MVTIVRDTSVGLVTPTQKKVEEPNSDTNVLVDWLTISFPPREPMADYALGVDMETGEILLDGDSGISPHELLKAKVHLAASLALRCDLDDWIDLPHGSNGYQKAILGPGNARIEWDHRTSPNVYASFPGKACLIMSEEGMRPFLKFVLANGGKGTRVDLTIDDYLRIVTPNQVQEAMSGPDVVTHATKGQTIQGFGVHKPELTGITCYLGAPSSRQRLRIYDKNLESNGVQNCIRWELQLRKEATGTVLKALADDNWGEVIASRLVSFVDFRGHASGFDVVKRTRLSWFEQLVGNARKSSAYLPKEPKTIEQVENWLDRSIAPTFALVMESWRRKGRGTELFCLKRMEIQGRERWKPWQKAILAAA